MNTTSTLSHIPGDSGQFLQDLIFLLIYSLTAIIALIGNLLVIKVVFLLPKMRNFVHILLANMALSDILCALSFIVGLIFCYDRYIQRFGNACCILNKALQLLSFQVSSVTMTAVAVDRWISVFFPFRNHNTSNRLLSVAKTCLILWLISITIIVATSPSLGYHRYFSGDGGRDPLMKCELAKAFDIQDLPPYVQRIRLMFANLAHFWIPLLLIILCYGSVSMKVWRRQIGQDVCKSQQDVVMMQKWKTIKMLIVTVVVFIICWLPFIIHNFVAFKSDSKKKRPCQQSLVFLITIWMAFSSCCYNPLIYWIYNEDYRNGLRGFFSLCNFQLCKTTDILQRLSRRSILSKRNHTEQVISVETKSTNS